MAKAKKKKHPLRRLLIWLIVLALAGGAVYLFVLPKWKAEATTTYNQYAARIGTISNSISFSGSVSVKNAETITADNAADVTHILNHDRIIKSQFLSLCLYLFLSRVITQYLAGRIARGERLQQEDDRRYAQNDRDEEQETFNNILQHVGPPTIRK